MLTLIAFVLALILSYAGLYVGVSLGVNSPEELTPGKKYFKFAKRFIFVFLIFTIIFLLKEQWPSLLLLFITYTFFRVVHKRWTFKLQEFYVVMAVLMLMVSKEPSAVFLLASIVFIYGLPTGSLLVEPHTKHKTLLLKKRQFYCKAFNMTADFISVLALMTLVFLFGQVR